MDAEADGVRLVPWGPITIPSGMSVDCAREALRTALEGPRRTRAVSEEERSRRWLCGIVREKRVVARRTPSLPWSNHCAPVLDAHLAQAPGGCLISGVLRPGWGSAGFVVAWSCAVAVLATAFGFQERSTAVGLTTFGAFVAPAYIGCMWRFWSRVPAFRADLAACLEAAGGRPASPPGVERG